MTCAPSGSTNCSETDGYNDDIAVVRNGGILFTHMTAASPVEIRRLGPEKVCGFHDKQGNSECVEFPLVFKPAN